MAADTRPFLQPMAIVRQVACNGSRLAVAVGSGFPTSGARGVRGFRGRADCGVAFALGSVVEQGEHFAELVASAGGKAAVIGPFLALPRWGAVHFSV